MRVVAAVVLLVLGVAVGVLGLLCGWQGVRFVRLAIEREAVGLIVQLAVILAAIVLPLVALICLGFGFLMARYALRRLGRAAGGASA